MPFVAHFLALLVLPQSGIAGAGDFGADETLALPGGPQVAVFRSITSEAASLRLSFAVREQPGEAGAGRLLGLQAEDRMNSLAARIGARAEVHRTPQGLVYQVTGARVDLDFLGWIIRAGIEPSSNQEFESVRRLMQTEQDRRSETPQGVLATRIRTALAPGVPSVFGTVGSLSRLDASRTRALWQRTHRRDNARLVIVGDVSTESALALAGDLGIPRGSVAGASEAGPLSEETGSPEPSPEVIRYWVVEGHPLQPGDEAKALVVARFLAEHVRASDSDFEAGVEIWDLGESRAMVVTAAAYPRSRSVMEERLGQLLQDASDLITEDEIARLAAELRTEIIMSGRTPWGLAELAGQAWDAGNGPEGLSNLVSSLHALTLADVQAFLDTTMATPPLREELRP